ncbi:MAG: DUF6531 domain-containing protein, partial [Acidimicrobiales bacterium]
MAAPVSACPDNLQAFVDAAKPASDTLVSAINHLRGSYDQFQASGSITVSNGDLMDSALPALASTQQTTDEFVSLTKQAFVTADQGSTAAGVVTVPASSFQSAFNTAALSAGVDPGTISSLPSAVTVPPATAGAIPVDSGYVNDPICTATGHFTEVEQDLVVPSRLGPLAWTRVYSSRLLEESGHGRGWWTWASASLVRVDDTTARYRGPDGKQAEFTGADAVWRRVPGVDATLLGAGGGLTLRWDPTSTWALQEWTFDPEGRLRTVSSPTLGVTTFVHEGDRLVRLDHEGGRRLDLVWEDDRIASVGLSDGRSVTYHYDSDGDLIAVDGPGGRRRYDGDGSGLIVAVYDADEVRLCHNTYDGDGRVTRQVSPLGRETTLEYLPWRRTRIGDTDGGPVNLFDHDEIGRLVGIVNAEGNRFHRSFDADGRVGAQTSFDGSEQIRSTWEGGATVTASGGGGESWRYDALDRTIAHERPGGRVVTFDYDGDALLPAVIRDPLGAEQRFVYDERDLLVAVVDGDGVRMEFDHDEDGCVVASRDGQGGVVRVEPGPTGQARRVTHTDGSTVSFDHDDAGRLLVITDEEANRFELHYTPAGRLAAVVDPRGGRIGLEYASTGAVERVINPLGDASDLRHDQLGSLVGLTNPDGSKWEYAQTLLGELSMVHAPDGGVWSIGHDVEGRPASFTEPLGRVEQASFDSDGRLRIRTDAAGSTTGYDYDEAGNLISTTTPTGAITTQSWDLADRPVERRDPDGVVEARRWSPGGRLMELAAGPDRRTFTYDELGMLASETATDGSVWRYRRDGRHRIAEIVSPEGRSTRYERDRSGRIVATTVGSQRTTATYDEAGNEVARTDPAGRTRSYEYDLAGRLTASVDPTGQRVEYRYDAAGNQVAMVDPLGGVVARRFDLVGRVRVVEDQMGRVTAFDHDRAGDLTGRTLPTGERVTYRRDERGLVSDVYVDGRNVVVYEHDADGRVGLRHEPGPDRTEAFAWSAAGRLVSWSDERRSMAWRYDESGRLAARRDAAGSEVAYDYDERGLLTSVSGAPWGQVSLSHDRDGRLLSLDADGSRRRWHYNEAGHMVGYAVTVGSSTSSVVVAYDAAGRVVTTADPDASVGSTSYAYDGAGRLIEATDGAGTSRWSYDGAGRIATETSGGRTRTLHYDAAHQLTHIDDETGTVTFSYDAGGRRVAESGPGGERRLRWDALGRLVAVDDGRGEVPVDVDASGHLVAVGDTTLTWDPTGLVPEVTALGDRSVLRLAGHVVATAGPDGVDWPVTDWRGSVGERGPWGDT